MSGLDLTALANEHESKVQNDVKKLLGPLAAALVHLPDTAHMVGVEETERRIKDATGVIQGRDFLAATSDDPSQHELLKQIKNGQLNGQQYFDLVQEVNNYREHYRQQQQQPQQLSQGGNGGVVDGSVVSDAQKALGDAVTELVTAQAKLSDLNTKIEAAETEARKVLEDANKVKLAKIKGKDVKGQADAWVAKFQPALHDEQTALIKAVAAAAAKVKAAAAALGAPVGS